MNMNDRMKQLIDRLLESLNKAAMDMYEYEVGLPIYDEDSKTVLRDIVLRWLEGNFDCRGLSKEDTVPEVVSVSAWAIERMSNNGQA